MVRWLKEEGNVVQTMTINEFEELISNGEWQHEQDYEIADESLNYIEEWDDVTDTLERIAIPYYTGWISVTSTFGDFKITYSECFSYMENDSDSLQTEQDNFKLDGFSVIDDDGDEIPVYELADFMDSRFNNIDYSVLNIKEVIDVDNSETDSDNEEITIEIDNCPDIRFTGKILATAKSSANNASSSYSGQTGHWTELKLYKTKGGKYICYRIGYTLWEGATDSHKGKVCETLDDVKAFFGHGWLAKELYAKAGIEDIEEVE